jgi:hypothetical protein
MSFSSNLAAGAGARNAEERNKKMASVHHHFQALLKNVNPKTHGRRLRRRYRTTFVLG